MRAKSGYPGVWAVLRLLPWLVLALLLASGCKDDEEPTPTLVAPAAPVPIQVSGPVTTLAGAAGTAGFTDGDPGTTARFYDPIGLRLVGGTLYVMDRYNEAIRSVDPATSAVTTVAGGTLGFADGALATAQFAKPTSAAAIGNVLYITDRDNFRIRALDLDAGTVSTLAGNSVQAVVDGVGAGASFARPRGIATDGTLLYVVEENDHVVRRVEPATGEVVTIAGAAGVAGFADGTGSAARFDTPTSLLYLDGTLYISDAVNQRIRQLDVATGAVTTLAGDGTAGHVDAATGTSAAFNDPRDMVTDGLALFVVERLNHDVRRIDLATTEVTTVAGSGSPGTADAADPLAAQFNEPHGLATDGTSLFVADRLGQTIRRID